MVESVLKIATMELTVSVHQGKCFFTGLLVRSHYHHAHDTTTMCEKFPVGLPGITD